MVLSLSHALRERAIATLNLDTVLRAVRLPLCVTDPSQPDNPVIYVNEAFVELTGYSEAESGGRNCRFLQGPDTEPTSIAAIKQAISDERSASVEIVNYRKDGTRFINALQIGPVLDDNGATVLFFGSQTDITRQRRIEDEAASLADRELVHRLNNVVTVMATIIRMTSKEYEDREELVNALIGRLKAIGDGHLRTLGTDHRNNADACELTFQIVSPYALHADNQLSIASNSCLLEPQHTTPVCLALHEFAINSVKYGALGVPEGRVITEWSKSARTIRMVWTEKNGPHVCKPDRTSGSDIIRRLVSAAGGTLDFDWENQGVIITLSLPRNGALAS